MPELPTPSQETFAKIPFDDNLNDVGWYFIDWFHRTEGKNPNEFNHIKSFLQGLIARWLEAHPQSASKKELWDAMQDGHTICNNYWQFIIMHQVRENEKKRLVDIEESLHNLIQLSKHHMTDEAQSIGLANAVASLDMVKKRIDILNKGTE